MSSQFPLPGAQAQSDGAVSSSTEHAASSPAPVLTEIPRQSDPTAPTASLPVRGDGLPLLNLALFFLTLVTTTMAGAYLGGAELSLLHPIQSVGPMVTGLTFSIPLMAILLAHEMGHYVTARRNRVDVSPPYFIPAPFPSVFLAGTFGAFIRIKSMPRSRRQMFDIGAAGPWAGFAVAVPVTMVGLALSNIGPLDTSSGGIQFGNSIIFLALTRWVLHVDPNLVNIDLSPMAFAGWLGLLVTMLNLLPASQLDGGHVVYALIGRRHRIVSRLVFVACVALAAIPYFLGWGAWWGWAFWAGLLLLFGLGHPVTADADTPLDPPRRFAAFATIALFIVTFTPIPIWIAPPTNNPPQQKNSYSVHSIEPPHRTGPRIAL